MEARWPSEEPPRRRRRRQLHRRRTPARPWKRLVPRASKAERPRGGRAHPIAVPKDVSVSDEAASAPMRTSVNWLAPSNRPPYRLGPTGYQVSPPGNACRLPAHHRLLQVGHLCPPGPADGVPGQTTRSRCTVGISTVWPACSAAGSPLPQGIATKRKNK